MNALSDPEYPRATCWNTECFAGYRPTKLEQKYCSRDCKEQMSGIHAYRRRHKEN